MGLSANARLNRMTFGLQGADRDFQIFRTFEKPVVRKMPHHQFATAAIQRSIEPRTG